jgi:hypothetical protein
LLAFLLLLAFLNVAGALLLLALLDATRVPVIAEFLLLLMFAGCCSRPFCCRVSSIAGVLL